jgi:hypothetical protein
MIMFTQQTTHLLSIASFLLLLLALMCAIQIMLYNDPTIASEACTSICLAVVSSI